MINFLHKTFFFLLVGWIQRIFAPFYVFQFAVILTCCPAGAQEMVFSPVEGRQQLNEEKIRNIIELKDGRIGVFTEGMLNIYDGNGFTTIHLDDRNAIPIPLYNGFHHSYLENNHLWLKCRGKLSLINISKGQSEKQPGIVLTQMGFTEKPIDLFVDTRKDVWIITQSGKLLCYEQATKKVKLFLKDTQLKDDPGDKVYDIVYHNGYLYLLYRSGLIRCFNRITVQEEYQKRIRLDNPDDFNEWIHATAVNNYIYIVKAGTNRGRLIRFDTATRKSVTLVSADNYWLNTFAANDNGNFVMSSSKGLWQFNPGSTKGTFYPKFKVLGRNDITTEVSTVFYDNQGGFWAGTLNKGLYYYHPERFRFPVYQKTLFQVPEDIELQINCFEEDQKGKLLVGTSEGLFAMRLPANGTTPARPLLPGVYCNALHKDAAGNIWIGTRAGLYMLSVDGKIMPLHPDATNYICETANGTIYICTANKGLLRWQPATESFICVHNEALLPNITQLTSWQGLLAGFSSKGPFLLNPVNGDIKVAKGKERNDLPMFCQKNYRYTCLLSDSAQNLWVGTYDGLTVWDSDNKKLCRIDTENGLINNSIKAIIEDKDHSIWVTTSRGVSHMIKKCSGTECEFKIINHYKHTGIIEHPFTERAAFLSSRYGMFFGGIDGMNNIPGNTATTTYRPLKPTFLSLKLFGKNVLPGSSYNGNIILKNTLPSTNKLVLDYNQNFLSIGFSGLNYINPAESHFRYKLKGIDDDWRFENPTSDYGEANYTGLPPGEYLFKLESSSDGIHWSDTPKTLSLLIKPPMWQTSTAKLLYVMIVCCLIWFVYKRQLKHSMLKREKQHVAAIERAKSDFITNMSHELRTPLTLIITPLRSLIQKLSDSDLKAELNRIGNNANLLLDTVNQLLEFKRIDAANETLHLHHCDSLSFIIEICDAYSEMANEKEIIFTTQIANGDLNIYIDKQKVKRIIVNLLSNAFKFTPAGGSVTLSVLFNDDTEALSIIIKDNGIGIQPRESARIFDRFYQADNQNENPTGSGIGLFMVKQYAELHGGTVTVASKPGNGTCFTVILPVGEIKAPIPHQTKQLASKKTVLLVEDHAGFREYLSSELSPFYNLVTAENGKVGQIKAVEHLPDIIISDMIMPEMDGIAFCKALRNTISISHTPVIMLTGRASDEARFEGYESGADAYLVKPFDIRFLLLRITKLLELTAARHTTFTKEIAVKTESITTNPVDKELLERALHYVYSNLSNPDYTVEKLSLDMGMDRTGLYRKLVALTGYPPINFIRSLRLKKAAELLSESNSSVSDVAEAVGFNSVSYFSKCFNESFKKTPREYRDEKISKN